MWNFVRSKYFYWITIVIIVVALGFSHKNRANFEMICGICAALFLIIQQILFRNLDEEEDKQKRNCRHIGVFSLLPSIGMVAGGIYNLFLPNGYDLTKITYAIVALSAVLFLCLLFQLVVYWKNKSVSGRFLRWSIVNTMLVAMSVVIVPILHITEADDGAMLGGMTAIILGCVTFLISVNMVLVSSCEYGGTIESIRVIRGVLRSRKLVFTRITILKDIFLVVGKTIISVISLSFFMFTNALYSTGMGIARFVALSMHEQEGKKKIASYRLVGIIIAVSSICYVLYSVRLFFGGKTNVYSMYIALIIALYTFVEFGINIREAIRLRKSKALEVKALRAVSFASTLICFVLTQTAIMSFAATGDNSFLNALSGVGFGILAAIIGVYIVIDSYLHERAEKAK